jgi:hypothetical protein
MNQRTNNLLLLTLLCVLVLSGVFLGGTASAVGQQTINSWVLAGGGGQASAGAYTLDGTIGQAVAGFDNAGNRELCAGFWCGVRTKSATYLPWVSSE